MLLLLQDYAAILARAEAEADVVLWDGGNNDTPFYKPDLWICVADPLRPGHQVGTAVGADSWYPAQNTITALCIGPLVPACCFASGSNATEILVLPQTSGA